MKIHNKPRIIESVPVYQQYRVFKDTLDKLRILGIIFSFSILSLLSITFLISNVDAIEIKADFNGDGNEDLAIGILKEDLGSIKDAGAVEVLYGSPSGLSTTSLTGHQLWTQDSINVDDVAEEGDVFGSSLSTGDFNGDGKDDLAIGVVNEDVGSLKDAGAVHVLYGSSKGLSATSPIADQFWTQDSTNVTDSTEADDRFGSSLSSGDFNGDGKDDLAIGAPFEDVISGSTSSAGQIQVLYGSPSGLSSISPITNQIWTQDSTNVDDVAEVLDLFGSYISTGDFNGDGKDDLAIGIDEEDVGALANAGAVEVLYGSSSGLSATSPLADQFWTQDSTNVNDLAEVDDFFGSSVSVGDFNGDGTDDLAIGIDEENVGSMNNIGAVQVLYGSTSGLSATSPIANQFWTQDSTNIDDVAEAGDLFGRFLSTSDFNDDGKDDLAIGIPNEDIVSVEDGGGVQILYGSSKGLSATSPIADQFWTQDSTNIDDTVEGFDYFGWQLP